MTLPNFLIIGAQSAGSTYLHLLRDKHDCIFVPSRRKEIHYFDRYFTRGRHGTRAFSRVAKRRLGSKQLAKQPPLEELPTHTAPAVNAPLIQTQTAATRRPIPDYPDLPCWMPQSSGAKQPDIAIWPVCPRQIFGPSPCTEISGS